MDYLQNPVVLLRLLSAALKMKHLCQWTGQCHHKVRSLCQCVQIRVKQLSHVVNITLYTGGCSDVNKAAFLMTVIANCNCGRLTARDNKIHIYHLAVCTAICWQTVLLWYKKKYCRTQRKKTKGRNVNIGLLLCMQCWRSYTFHLHAENSSSMRSRNVVRGTPAASCCGS